MKKKYLIIWSLFILIINWSFVSCDNYKRKTEHIYKIDVFNYYSPTEDFGNGFQSSSEIINKGNIVFKVFPSAGLIYDSANWDKDTISLEWSKTNLSDCYVENFEFLLFLDTCLSVNQLISFAEKLGVYNSKLNEHIYWLCQLTRAKLVPNKSPYGDITGYFAVAPNGEYIPNEYFSINYQIFDMEKKNLKIFAKRVALIEDAVDNNLITVFIEPIHGEKNYAHISTDFSVYSFVEDNNHSFKLNIKNSKFHRLINPNYEFQITIKVASQIKFFSDGRFEGFLKYAPYRIRKL